VFRSRLDRLAAGGKRPPLMFPVLWGPEATLKAKLPAAVTDIQYKHADFGKLYAEKGLFELMTVNEYRDSYRNSLETLRSYCGSAPPSMNCRRSTEPRCPPLRALFKLPKKPSRQTFKSSPTNWDHGM